jgi:phosphoribosylglycinamide formyltransferase-1
VPVEEDDDVASLSERILHLEHRLYVRAVRLYCEDRIHIEGRAVKILPPRQKPKEEGELQ